MIPTVLFSRMFRRRSFPPVLPLSALVLLGALLQGVLPSCSAPPQKAVPPPTLKAPVTETLHGTTLTDDYRWLEDGKSPATRAWIAAQNAYTRSVLDSLPGRKSLAGRFEELLRVDSVGTPVVRGGRYFFSRRLAGEDLASICMRRGPSGKDEVLVDPLSLASGGTKNVLLVALSRDGKVMAYAVREGGADEVVLRLFDVERRRDLPDRMPKGRYFGVAMKPDLSGFYYSTYSREGPRVLYHAMGTEAAADRVVFGEGFGPGAMIGVTLSEDGRTLLFTVSRGSSGTKTEIYFQRPAGKGPVRVLVSDLEARFSPRIAGNRVFLSTDWKAPNGRILAVDLDDPGRDGWREIVPEKKDAVIRGFTLAGGRLFVRYLENVVSRLAVFDAKGRHLKDIAFPSLGSVSSLKGRWESGEAFFSYQSFNVPRTVYRYDVATGKKTVWARSGPPVESGRYAVSQVWFTSKDGTRVPMFLVHLKSIVLDGSHPALLYGYGGFDISLTPRFDPFPLVFVEHGGVYAVANLRGGGEFGEEWHRAGMLGEKQNVFDDFIAAAEWLVEKKYTTCDKLAAMGGSNGGLLVGAALTQRPDLFKAVICAYPLLDMVRYHRFLVARLWVSEYGCSEDPEQFSWLLAYSPYQNVHRGVRYPAVLFVTGDSDTRVDPLHARKMTALLQAKTASPPGKRPVLLLYDTRAGHSGGMPVTRRVEEMTDRMSFLLAMTGGSP